MSTTRVSEYDAFGPWIDEVEDAEGVPRLFRDHPLDHAEAHLVLKVPREIARRDATADMDLYDYLLILDATSLTVLTRHGAGASGRTKSPRHVGSGGYGTLTVPYEQVVAVRNIVNLLDARLTIHTASGSAVSVRYNGAAGENATRLVDALRAAATVDPAGPVGEQFLARAASVGLEGVRLDPGREDQVLVSSFAKLSKSIPDTVAWACHGRLPLAPNSSGIAGIVLRATHALSPMTLHGGVLASDGRALEILGRDRWLVRGRLPVQSTSRLVVPLGSLEGVTVSAHPVYPDATVATLIAGDTAIDVVIPTGSDAHHIFSAGVDPEALQGDIPPRHSPNPTTTTERSSS